MDQLSYRRHRFPPPLIQHAIWLYLRFTLSYRDVEELLAERGLEPLGPEQRHDLLEIVEDRYGRGATLITSQIPVDRWHDLIGEPTLADAILDRIIHNAHRLQLRGDSLRKQKAPKIAAT